MKVLELVALILMQVTLIFIFVTVFFFSYVKKVEEDIIAKQIKQVILDLKTEIRPFTLGKVNVDLGSPPDLSEADATVIESQKSIFRAAMRFLCIVAICTSIVIITLLVVFKFPASDILIEAIIGSSVVVSIEYLFLVFFVKNYISFDENEAKNAILRGLLQGINKA